MAPVKVTIVSAVDSHYKPPNSRFELSDSGWKELVHAVKTMASYDRPSTLSVIVRPASLYEVSGELFSLPRMCRPVIRFGEGGDPPGVSPEWSGLDAGFYHLSSGAYAAKEFHLWVLGTADICMAALNLPAPKTFLITETGGKNFERGVEIFLVNGDKTTLSLSHPSVWTTLAPSSLRTPWPYSTVKFLKVKPNSAAYCVSDSDDGERQPKFFLGKLFKSKKPRSPRRRR
ncbi:virion protein US2 [Gallid alphaherpesvirus 1]|uniref:Virion protein US2 n=1 Tax=Infectious laryngotracheitis virus TaxID=10386 RepID=A0A0K0K5W7_ILTV|nr:virion protein US2 [Gallid alphaherpesvirus 1]